MAGFVKNEVKNENATGKAVMTNRMFINISMEPEDVTKIIRVFNWWLASRCDRYAPIWVKEMYYEEWLESPFDQKAWASAGIPRALPGSIPKGYCKSVRRFIHPMGEAKRMYSKKNSAPNETIQRDQQGEGLFLSEMNAGVTVNRRKGGATIEKK